MTDVTAETRPPLPLLVKGRDPEEIVAYACGLCGIVHQTEAAAAQCSVCRCYGCKRPLPKDRGHGSRCQECWEKMHRTAEEHRHAQEAKAYEKAQKIPLADYGGKYLQRDGIGNYGCGDDYVLADSVDDIFDECAATGEEPPTWLWACTPVRMAFDAGDLIVNACEEMHEDAPDEISASAEKELQAFLDAWCEKNSPTSYTPSYKTAIDVSAALADWRARRGSAGEG